MQTNYLVEMFGITKSFSGVKALDAINFNLVPGEVHVLLGENGAGKSTLMKILSGVYQPSAGKMVVGDKKYSTLTPKLAKEHNISIIHQELSVINELSIAENIFVGKLPEKKRFGFSYIDYEYMKTATTELLKRVGLHKDPSTIVEELRISEKQLVEIAKALADNAKVLIMDEPTSSLTEEETHSLFKIIKQLKAEGVGIIYISHKLKEIKEIGHRITVLKDGCYVGTELVENVEIPDMVRMMVGRDLQDKYLSPHKTNKKVEKEIIFEVEHMTQEAGMVKDVSFKLHKGEILGFAGLIGSGRTELMNTIFGVDKKKSGTVKLNGKTLKIKTPYDAIKEGMAYITENRRETGFFHNFEIWKNISQGKLLKDSKCKGIWGMLQHKQEMVWAEEQKKVLNIKCNNVEQNIMELSGGNQQKVIISRSLKAEANLFIFDEPTKGIDVGAKSEIYKIMRDLAENGKGIIMVSSELLELLANCDRIIVFNDGEISGILNNDEATEESIMMLATSSKSNN